MGSWEITACTTKRTHFVFINDATTEVFYDVLVFYYEIVFKQIIKKKLFSIEQ